MARVLDGDVDFADYFPASERDPAEMFAELRGIVAGIGNPHLRGLLEAFLDDEPLARMYRTGARRQARASCVSRRIDRARAFALPAVPA